jgi:hypothetical protein
VIYRHLFWPVRTYTADDVDQKIDIIVLEETLTGGTYGVGEIPTFFEGNDAQPTAWKYSTVRVEEVEESVNVGVKHANTVAFPEEMVGYVAANPLSAASDDDVVSGWRIDHTWWWEAGPVILRIPCGHAGFLIWGTDRG